MEVIIPLDKGQNVQCKKLHASLLLMVLGSFFKCPINNMNSSDIGGQSGDKYSHKIIQLEFKVLSLKNIHFCAPFSSTYTKIGKLQRLAWLLCKEKYTFF